MTETTQTGKPAEFYSLPAHKLTAGMSTADGQDITDVWYTDELVGYDTYTPADDPDEDDYNRSMPDDRIAGRDELVDLAVFSNTQVDGRVSS
jgi:hypothetical protein